MGLVDWVIRKGRSVWGNALTGISSAYLERGRIADGIDTCRRSVRWYEEARDPGGLSVALSNLGNAMLLAGEWEEAERCAHRSLATHTEGAVPALILLGSIDAGCARFHAALERFEQALRLAERTNDTASEAKAHGSIASALLNLGLVREGIASQEQALRLETKRRNVAGTIESLLGLGVMWSQIDSKRAIFWYEQAIEAARRKSYWNLVASARVGLAGEHISESDFVQASRYLAEARQIYIQLGDPLGELELLRAEGQLAAATGDREGALRILDAAAAGYRRLGDGLGEAKALSALSQYCFELGRFADGEGPLRRAIELCEAAHFHLRDKDRLKISFDERTNENYKELQYCLVAQDRTDEALEVAERGRARAFADLLNRRLARHAAASPTPPRIAEIRAFANATGATIVEYSFVKADRLMAWVVRPDGAVVTRTLAAREPPALLGSLPNAEVSPRSQARSIEWSEEPGASGDCSLPRRCHQWLIEPIRDALPADPNQSVIFVPHERLFAIPFAALADEQGSYLVERHTILTAPSIQALIQIASDRRPAGAGALVVGNPKMPLAPTAAGPVPLHPLPFAELEARRIAAMFGANPVLGCEATKARVLAEAPGRRIVHLATHGLLGDLNSPGLPGAVALAPEGDDSGLLGAEEWMDIALCADLVALSACHTARGRITADGVVGLSRALLSAGARSVLVGLLPAPDEGTAHLMSDFYEAYLGPELRGDKAGALRRAMCLAIRAGESSGAWVGFTLIGERFDAS